MAYNRQFLEWEWAKSSGWSNGFSSFGPWHISSLQYSHSPRRTTIALYSICQVSNRNLRDEDWFIHVVPEGSGAWERWKSKSINSRTKSKERKSGEGLD
jgi:hypothetical protein